jgi:hypothetical protein
MTVGIVIFVVFVGIPILYSFIRPNDPTEIRRPGPMRRLPLLGGASFIVFMWADMISDIASGWLINILFGGGSSETGRFPDYHYAKNHRRDGERDKAIAAIQNELRKEPKNFEGRLLLAEIYQDLNQPKEALAQLHIILENPDATPDQKEVARNEEENCRQLQRHLDEAAFFKQQSGQ